MFKNVLIISMSTMRKDSKQNYYYVKEGEEVEAFYCGKYSMEPGTKHILNKLSKEKQKINKIIMLTTPEAKGEAESDAKNETKKTENVNAAEYYKEEIIRFIKYGDCIENSSQIEGLNDQDKKILFDFETKLSVKYTEDELNNLFKEIDLFDADKLSYEAVPEIVKIVSQELENGKYEVRLFQDMQGGSRVSTFIINAAVHMLQDDNIKLDSTYATLFNNANKVHQLRDESLSNRVLDMVSGMDEFLNYGRAKKFKEYFDYYEEYYKHENDLAEEALVDTICQISDAISICNIKGFYDGLDQLQTEITTYSGKNKDEKDPIFQAFVQKIEKTYAGILSKDRRAIDVMEWCLNKEWYQQALTVCEAKIPEQMIKEKVVYYCADSADKNDVLSKFAEYYELKKDKCQYTKDSAIFVIKNYKHSYKKEIRYIEDKENYEGSLVKLIKDNELYSDYGSKDGEYNELNKVLKGYFKLAKERNKVNHVGDPVELDILKNNMKEFIGNYKDLIGNNWENNTLTDDCLITMDEIVNYKK